MVSPYPVWRRRKLYEPQNSNFCLRFIFIWLHHLKSIRENCLFITSFWHIKCIKTSYVIISYLTCKPEIIRSNYLVPAKTWKFWYQIYMFKEVEKGEIELGNYGWPLRTWTYDNWGWWLERGFYNFILENIKNSAKVIKFIVCIELKLVCVFLALDRKYR